MASSCEKTILIVPHEKRKFNEKLNYITSPGYLDGTPGARKRAGLLGAGPYRVITTKAIMGFDEKTHRMKILHTLPGETVESVKAATGFELLVADNVSELPAPTKEEIRLIRDEIDPLGFFIKKAQK